MQELLQGLDILRMLLITQEIEFQHIQPTT
jgi:hypothetical protein